MTIFGTIIDLCCADKSALNKLKKFGKKHEDEEPEVTEESPKPAKASQPKVGVPKHGPATRVKTNKFSHKDTKYNDVVFEKLPVMAKKSVEKLGYSKDTWDNDGWCVAEDKWFEDLTPEERKAAESLGWDKTAWDTRYEDKNWDELPEVVKNAATLTGFTEQMWNDDEWPEDLDKHWDELTAEQKLAMNVLGYHKYAWD